MKFPTPHGESEVIEVEGDWQIFAGRAAASASPLADGSAPPAPGRLLEAALFAAAKPLQAEVLGRLFPGWKAQDLEHLFAQMNQNFREQGRPCRAVREQGGWILRLLAEAMPQAKQARVQNPAEVELPQDAVDVLALVAYRQPIPKEEIDAIRGADSAAASRRLMRLGLIKMESDKNGKMFRTTDHFLELLGIGSLKDLPRTEEAS